MFSLAKKTPLTMELFYLYFHQTCKKREIQHKRIFHPKNQHKKRVNPPILKFATKQRNLVITQKTTQAQPKNQHSCAIKWFTLKTVLATQAVLILCEQPKNQHSCEQQHRQTTVLAVQFCACTIINQHCCTQVENQHSTAFEFSQFCAYTGQKLAQIVEKIAQARQQRQPLFASLS